MGWSLSESQQQKIEQAITARGDAEAKRLFQ